ncbi:MAG: hypothetical protein ACP5JJ_18465 [Anaerolineae bacterium]
MAEDRFPFEIRDAELDAAALAERVSESVAKRRAASTYNPDVATIGPDSLRLGRTSPPGDATAAELPDLYSSLAELLARARLDEPDFTSRRPVVGRLIVAVRRAWNWMSTKWYVRPLLDQQGAINVQTAQLLSDLVYWHEAHGQRLHELEARLVRLEAWTAKLEEHSDQ